MGHLRAVVVLHVLSLTDPFPSRSLTFNNPTDRIEIGRASKRENKNLAPSPHNALFDSRVMSRIHAVLRVSQEKKLVYVCDPGSMHGTWLNKKKIPLDKEITLSDGDELTFGVEVIRGSETFPPLAVRCECQWLETPHVPIPSIDKALASLRDSKEDQQKPCSLSASNTFCVPDDDDDDDDYDDEDIEFAAATTTAVDLTTDQTSESNASDAGSDSEDSRSVVEVPSPMTSPLKNGDPKDTQPSELLTGPTQGPIQNSDKPSNVANPRPKQPLATPRMTPPSTGYESEDAGGEDQYYDEYFAHSSGEESNVEAENWDVDGGEEEEEEEQADDEQQQEEDEDEEGKEDEGPKIPNLVEVTLTDLEQRTVEPAEMPTTLYHAWNLEQGASSGGGEPQTTTNIPVSASNPRDSFTHSLLENKLSSNDPPQKERTMPCTDPIAPLYAPFTRPDPQHYYLPSARLPEPLPSYIGNSTFLPPLMQKPQSHSGYTPPLQNSYSSTAPYNDGPFAAGMTMSNVLPPRPPRANTTSGSSKHSFMPFREPVAPHMPRTFCDATLPQDTTKVGQLREWKPPSVTSKLTSGTKRKAAEMETELEATEQSQKTHESVTEDTNLPDAQPQAIITVPNGSESQLTTLSLSESAKEVKEVERPSKQVKTSHRSSIRSHAATAIVGAVVGAVGTIAALASLPPDYFA
ncbi:FHA domain protein [Aspergillus undulatus]|uniref:FHA domain protein n=1 Tax=Aspergillus undulatus TaxID=1810928 RepID=UPI003CCE3D6F